jgi:quinol-cytochrome oxidoreductase complex cytochrome b subunit
MSIFQELREQGAKKFIFGVIDNTVVRITAGLNINDIRSVLRGDPAAKPNPRVKPHTEGFVLHIRPTFYHQAVTTLYPTFRLGFLSALLFLIEIVTGTILMVFYSPTPDSAYQSMLKILSSVPLGQFMRDIHRLAAEGMVIVVTLHMFRTFLTGSYKAPRQFTWLTGVVLLLVTLGLSFTGYLLPWDQLAFWAVTIGTSMADKAPIGGNEANLLLRGAVDISANGLLRFYLLHIIFLPLLGILFVSVHYYKVIRHGHSLPPGMEAPGEDNARKVPPDKRVPFLPDILTTELLWMGLTIAVLVVGVSFFYHAPLEHHADPQVTPLHTTAPWYFLWIQGMLKMGNPTLYGVILPTVIFLFLALIPYIDFNPSRLYKDRRIAISLGLIVCAVLVVLTYMGTPAFGVKAPSPNEVGYDFIPPEHPGPIRSMPFEQLIAGEYDTTKTTEVANAPKLTEVLKELQADIARRADLPDGHAVLVIENWQSDAQGVNLKKVTLRILWKDAAQPYENTVYVHRDSDYGSE